MEYSRSLVFLLDYWVRNTVSMLRKRQYQNTNHRRGWSPGSWTPPGRPLPALLLFCLTFTNYINDCKKIGVRPITIKIRHFRLLSTSRWAGSVPRWNKKHSNFIDFNSAGYPKNIYHFIITLLNFFYLMKLYYSIQISLQIFFHLFWFTFNTLFTVWAAPQPYFFILLGLIQFLQGAGISLPI